MFLIILSAAGLTAGLSEGGWRSIPQTATQCDYETQKPTWGILSRKVASARAKELAPATPEDMQRQLEAQMTEQAARQARIEAEEMMKLKIPVASTKKTEVLTKHITAESKKDPALMAQVVRSWLSG